MVAVQKLPQNFLQVLPDCCLQRLPAWRILQRNSQRSPPREEHPLSSGERTVDEGMSESANQKSLGASRENGPGGAPKRQEEVRSSPGEQIPAEGSQN